MKKIQEGYQNEFYFVLEFNNKKVFDLNPMLYQVIESLFMNVKESSIIKSWRNHNPRVKGDIFIKIGKDIKTISIKKGSRNSVHLERIDTFTSFLRKQGIRKEIIDSYIRFHYGIDSSNSIVILSAKEYKEKYRDDIIKLNQCLSKVNIDEVVNRFILQGRLSHQSIDGIIYGVPNDFLWITQNDILMIIRNSIHLQSSGVHIGCLFIQPQSRCLNENVSYNKCRDYVQIKWYSLFDDILLYKAGILKNDTT